MRVRFYLESNKTVKKDKTIWCYIREKGQCLYLNTGQKIKKDYWDKENQRANLRKVKNPSIKAAVNSLNKVLDAYESKITVIANTVRMNDVTASFDKVLIELRKVFKKDTVTIFSAFDDFLKCQESEIAHSTMQKYKRVKKLLIKFEKKENFKLAFDSINARFYDKYKPFLISEGKGMNNNTAHKHIKSFKVFMNWAVDRGLTDNLDYKKHGELKIKNPKIIFLTEVELMKLYNMELESERLQRVRDVFVFQCFTGVRYSDVENINRVDIDGATWRVDVVKTEDHINIPLSAYALSILAKYQDHPKPLPIISNQKMNKYLKELCEKAEFDTEIKITKHKGNVKEEEVFKKFQLIGTHTARRTFVSLSLIKGMKPKVIMEITGHKTYEMMDRYLKVLDDTKREEMEKTWGGPLKLVN